MKKYALILLLILTGCAPKVTIMLDGVPLPDYVYHLSSPETGLVIEVYAAKYINTDEEGEPILWPIYLRVDETYYIDPDITEYVKITVKVRNPEKVWYELRKKSFNKILIGRGKANTTITEIYSGRLKFNDFDIAHKTTNNTMQSHTIEVRDKRGLSIMRIGKFSYKVIHQNQR